MIQFNLLPSVKLEHLKAKRLKRIISLSATGVIAACFLTVAGLISVVVFAQPKRLNDLDKSIKSVSNDIKSTKDINKVLTIQNQLSVIDKLHSDKPAIERLFTFITQITPKTVSIQSFSADVETAKIEVTGQAPTIEEMNKYIDTLKFTSINYGDATKTDIKAFPQVVLSSYAINQNGAGFNVSITYELDIFKSEKTTLKLSVPKITSTRSETERPTDLFKVNVTPIGEEAQ